MVRCGTPRFPQGLRRFTSPPTFPQHVFRPQTSPKLFLTAVVSKCVNMLAFAASQSYIDNHERRTRSNYS